LGTGNGSLLVALREDGWEGVMVGVDYSDASVELARRGAGVREVEDVRFEVWDVIGGTVPKGEWMVEGGFDVVLDKGTFDAISYSEGVDGEGRRVCEGYRERVGELVRRGGVVVVTSCNWTEEELGVWFVGGESIFEVCGRIEYPVFRFGGKVGQSVCTVAFRRKG
jgi:hypothetical protein